MGLAKAVEAQPQTDVVPQVQPPDGIMNHEWNGVPIDLLRYYGIHLEEATPQQTKRLREMCEIINDELTEKTIGNIMGYLNNLDLKLGATPVGENRLDRMWSYLKLHKNIKEMQLRQRAYER